NASVTWSPAANLSTTYGFTPVLTPKQQQEYTARFEFASGCITVDTQLVRVFKQDDIHVPKAFTPNGDGKNDVLKPILVGVRELSYFRIYNRWGNLLFETRDANKGW